MKRVVDVHKVIEKEWERVCYSLLGRSMEEEETRRDLNETTFLPGSFSN